MLVMLWRRNWKQENVEEKRSISQNKFQRKNITYANTQTKTAPAAQSILHPGTRPFFRAGYSQDFFRERDETSDITEQ